MRISFAKTLRTAAAGIGLLFAGQAAQAATITLDQLNVNTTPGTDFTVTVLGQDFTAGTNGSTAGGTLGGGLTVAWNPAVITLDSLADLTIVFPGDELFAPAPVLNSAAGTLSFSVASFNGTALSNFNIAQLTFTANAGGGVSAIDLTVSALDVWADNGFPPVDMTPTAVDGLVTVAITAVPLPAPILLLGSGMLGLVLIARGKASRLHRTI